MSRNPYDLSALRYNPSPEEILLRRVSRLEREVIELKKQVNILSGIVKPLIEMKEENE